MHPGDEFFYLCLHLAKHLMPERGEAAQSSMCISVLPARDLHLATGQWGPKVDWLGFLANVDRFHLSVPVRNAIVFLFRWFECDVPELDILSLSYLHAGRNTILPGQPILQYVSKGFAFVRAQQWLWRPL